MRNLNFKKFLLYVTVFSALCWLGILLTDILTKVNIHYKEFFSSWFISVLNLIIGVKLLMSALEKKTKQFMILSLGSMTVRLFVTIIVVVVLIAVFKFDKIYFILSFLTFYFILLIFEVIFLNSYSNKDK